MPIVRPLSSSLDGSFFMLESIRGHLQGWPVRILMAVLVVAFAVWGIGDVFRGGLGGTAVAEVGGVEVTTADLRREFEQNYRNLQQRGATGIDRRQAIQLGLMQQSLQGLIADRLVAAHAHELGVTIADATLAERIRLDPSFQDAAGVFSRDRVALIARSMGVSEDALLESVRAEMVRNEMLRAVTQPAVAPATLARQIWLRDNETRSGRALVVLDSAIEVPDPDEQALSTFLEENKAGWQTPEFRGFTVALLSPGAFAEDAAVSEEAVRADYDARIAEFRTPERRETRQLLAPDEQTAKAAAELLASGKSMAEVAAEMADRSVTTEALGAMTRDQLPPELADAIFALQPGQDSPPVQSLFGWHVFRLERIEPESTTPFEQARADIERQLRLNAAAEQLPELGNKLEDAIAGGASLEEAAVQVGATVRKVEGIDRQGRDRDGKSLPGERLPAEVLASAFETPADDTSNLEETSDGGYFVVHVDRVEPARTNTVDEVRARLTEAWRARQRSDRSAATARELRERAAAGESLEALAALSPGSEVRPIGPINRQQGGPELEPAAVAQIFDTEAGKAVAEVARMVDGHAVLVVDEVERPEPPADLASRRDMLANEFRRDLLQQYEAALRLRFPARVDEGLLGSMIRAEEG
ncbi:MAG TPA: peptidyl-prolyl cis-trans isomerase [Geminicoccaceae bacterium]|nr:peptidyl-prolyl cis-trans isomerase [Geminicoccus sp.]HMU52710.1 peptidyl-prolyl cis-trans isomerase [Geminicoccaceae bacterium]